MRPLSDERHQNLEAAARCYSNMTRRALLDTIAKHTSATMLDIQRAFPGLVTTQISYGIRPLLKAGLVRTTRRTSRGRSHFYSLTPKGIQALRDLHDELSDLLAALEAHRDETHP
ncbi:winged helix DNA-binding protein [Deinococcus sp.]|uniref:winged helix DNA-binding protein n=1 Tax=Deinococcus sp. TaxID=47478 RepID=UPI0034C612D0